MKMTILNIRFKKQIIQRDGKKMNRMGNVYIDYEIYDDNNTITGTYEKDISGIGYDFNLIDVMKEIEESVRKTITSIAPPIL